jgi:hypothetical protein
MWAITSYFNPARYRRRHLNYKIFRARLGVPLVTVELSFDGRFELTDDDADILIQISEGAVLWQKERLFNVALRAVPLEEKYIAWLDCDAIFAAPDWNVLAEESLAQNHVVQLFSDVLTLAINDTGPNLGDEAKAPTGYSFMRQTALCPERAFAENVYQANIQADASTNRGLAWAGRREVLDEHGLYDGDIAGRGDRAVAFAIAGAYNQFRASID